MTVSARETPMMKQYLAVKAEHPDAIVFYRMGDFYEMFLEDAELAAPLLDIALTSRDKNKPDPVPMCGVPVHAADQHIKTLAGLGHKVAICEQIEDAKKAGGKRLVRRAVIEVVTPGLVGDPTGIAAESEIALVAVDLARVGEAGLAVMDASTGDFRATAFCSGAEEDSAALPEALLQEIERISPRELLVSAQRAEGLRSALELGLPGLVVTELGASEFDPTSVPVIPEGFEASTDDAAMRASAALLRYLGTNQPFSLAHTPRLRRYALVDTMLLDAATRAHLELFENAEDRGRKGTLVEQIDCSVTPLGARRLARWLAYPLIDSAAIDDRQDAVGFFAARDRPRARLREAMKGVRDLERLLARGVRPASVPRDLGQLRSSLLALPDVVAALEAPAEGLLGGQDDATPPSLVVAPTPIPELAARLRDALIDEPPVIAKGSRGAHETGYIREGYRSELDVLRESAEKGREWIAGLEAQERERSGISKLKVCYHPVHGYSLEVPKSQLARVPKDYERKQTLANVERFTTDRLREVEVKVMGASERAAELERSLFDELRTAVVESAVEIRAAAAAVSELDALAALAETARQRGWVRPEVDDTERLEIRGGRHPVVEALLERSGADGFVANDTQLDTGDAQILLLTGPNMSGKSTYLRQVALVVLLGQMGSFVPAESAKIGVVDRIFTRVGASDRLARGESTFMVEMRETAEILCQASSRSLVILDEIGRGTSTFDGLAIAWAVAEYLHDTPGLTARTLFATHYHELIELALTKPRVRNAHFDAREYQGEVVFLRRLVTGGASRSYGIQVARLAGLPTSVIARATEILGNLEGGELDARGRPRLARGAEDAVVEGEQAGVPSSSGEGQLAFALATGDSPNQEEREALDALRAADLDRTTPVDALLELRRLKQLVAPES
ncbi:MAG: DNA mismatch repair protein MutS, partial [Myxococcota bacterium]|nr:DNA mismatch repair protein MutS [Myxococcota bacterium]